MMERSQFSVQLANYNKHHKKTSSDSFNYQIPYKIGPVVSSNKIILKNSELFHSYDSTTSISTEGLYTKKSSLLINDKLSSNKAATLNDSRYVTKVDISIEGESSQQFVTTIPIASHKVDSQNNGVLSVGKEVPTIYIVDGDDAKLKGRIPEDSSSVKRDIKLVDGVREQCSTHLNENVCSLKSKTPTTENIDQNGNSNDFHNSSQQDTDYKIDLIYNSKCVSDTKSIKYKLDDATQSDNQVDNADDLIGDYNTCSCCSEEIYIVHHSNEIDVLQPNIKGEVECLDVVNSSFNYLKESKSSENLSLYSFIANEERETDIHIGDNYGYSGLEDRDHDSDIHLDVQNSNTTAYRSHDRIESAYTDFKSSYTSDDTLNEDQNDNDASNKVTSDSTEDYNRRDNLVKAGYLKCALSDHDNNTNKIDCLGIKEESVLNSTEKVDNPILYEEVKAKCERHNKIIGSDRENENSINSSLNGYNEGIRTEKDLEYTENQPKKTDLAAPDIIISNCVIEDNMAGKTASKNHQPDIISIPERTKLMMNSNSLDCDETWNIAKQKKTKKILTLPPKIKESVLEEDVEENQLELGKNRLLHVPVSNKVLIPVILKDPSPPQLLKKRKTGVVENNTDLDELKEMARKLNLSTRRPSYLMWKERLKSNTLSANQGCLNKDSSVDKVNGDTLGTEDSATNTRMESLTQTLAWLRRELIEMRSQDQVLARTLLRLRQDIREFKLQRSCAEHQEILEDAIDLEEEKDLLGELSCDYIQESFSPTLKNVGVTRMHIGRRRFSVF